MFKVMRSIGEDRPSGKGRFLVGDSESKNLLNKLKENDSTEQHVVVFKDYLTNEVFIFFDPYEEREPRQKLELDGEQDGYLVDAMLFMREAEAVAFHNGFGYDQPAFEKCFGKVAKYNCFAARQEGSKLYDVFPFKYMDTYVVSTLLNPDRKPPKRAFLIGKGNVGAHSIEAHGIEINRYKPENEDWTVLTDHMIHRCVEDVEIGTSLLTKLMRGEWASYNYRKNPISKMDLRDAYRMECRIGYEMAKQADRGFRLDMQWCMQTWNELNKKIADVEAGFRPHMPMRIAMRGVKPEYWETVIQKMQEYSAGMPAEDQALVASVINPELYKRYFTAAPSVSKNSTQWNLTKKNGEYTAALRKVFPEMSGTRQDTVNPLVDGAFTPVTFEDIPLGNRDSVKQVLFKYGWLGVTYNDAEEEYFEQNGEYPNAWSGKINEASIDYWKERMQPPEWCLDIAKWYILCSRRNQILNPKDVQYLQTYKTAPAKGVRGLIGQAYCKDYQMSAVDYYLLYGEFPTDADDDWRVPAIAIPIGTNTFRMRHKVVVNIPSRGLYPLRRAFIAGKGKKILGCDGSGLELRMLSHFMKDAEYEHVILHGDIHSYNQDKAGLPTRDNAKTFNNMGVYKHIEFGGHP